MPFPEGIGVVDLMVGIPAAPGDMSWQESLRPLLRDRQSLESFAGPAQYMFKDLPAARFAEDPVAAVLSEMDRFGVETAMIGVNFDNEAAVGALRRHPDRFIGSYPVDPNRGMEAVGDLVRAHEQLGVRAATAFPSGLFPQVPINDRRFFPLYAKCVELDIPIFVCAGVPGPRVPFAPQRVELIDEVCWSFPELRFVTRHGCEPWTELAVMLMLKWPNLYYSTSAFAPKHYPTDIIEYANTRGAEKILYAGYFPMGLSLERIMTEMREVAFRDHVWPLFLRENARRVLKLG